MVCIHGKLTIVVLLFFHSMIYVFIDKKKGNSAKKMNGKFFTDLIQEANFGSNSDLFADALRF